MKQKKIKKNKSKKGNEEKKYKDMAKKDRPVHRVASRGCWFPSGQRKLRPFESWKTGREE
jgi:hypothetical protein